MNLRNLKALVDQALDLESRIEEGKSAWGEGTDEFAMAGCDPSDQYELSSELEGVLNEIKEVVNK